MSEDNTIAFPKKARTSNQRAVRTRRSKRETPDWDVLQAMYRAGMSFGKMAELPEAAGRTKQAISHHASKNGWVRDMTYESKLKAQEVLAMARSKTENVAVTEKGVDVKAFDEKDAAAMLDELLPKRERAQSRQAEIYRAIVEGQVKVGDRQQKQIDKLRVEVLRLNALVNEFWDSETSEDRREDIRVELCGTKDTMVDVTNKLVAMNSRLQADERRAFDMDVRKQDEDNPYLVPAIPRRGAPPAPKPKEDSDKRAV